MKSFSKKDKKLNIKEGESVACNTCKNYEQFLALKGRNSERGEFCSQCLNNDVKTQKKHSYYESKQGL